MEEVTLEEVVRKHITLPVQPRSNGWYSIRCQVCDENPRKKRGGWLFSEQKVAYHCFNCGISAVYDECDGNLSKVMRDILAAYQIPADEIHKVIRTSMRHKKANTPKTAKKLKLETKELLLPSHFYELGSHTNDPWDTVATEYLDTRGMSPADYKFYLSDDKMWKGRLIIPMYRKGRLIFYQGRDMTGSKKRVKYLSPAEGKDSVFYNYDEITKSTEEPLYITEGFFDAFHIQAIATLGNEMSDIQVKILTQSRRPKVVIPDRRGDGDRLANQALDLGWSVSFPDISSCKDVNEAIVKYGKLFVLKSIVDNIFQGLAGRLRVGLFCEKSKTRK